MGSVPAIYWYLLVVAFFIWMVVGLSLQSIRDHRARMAALDILRTYAEKGIEPPASMSEPLGQFGQAADKAPADHSKRQAKKAARQAADHMAKFSSDIFVSGLAAAICWWRVDAGGPQWAIIVSGIFAAVAAAGALGNLVAAVTSPRN